MGWGGVGAVAYTGHQLVFVGFNNWALSVAATGFCRFQQLGFVGFSNWVPMKFEDAFDVAA